MESYSYVICIMIHVYSVSFCWKFIAAASEHYLGVPFSIKKLRACLDGKMEGKEGEGKGGANLSCLGKDLEGKGGGGI